MTELSMWITGISFCAAVMAVIVAVHEHQRAKKAERALSQSIAATTALFEGIAATHARSLVAVAKRVDAVDLELKAQDAMIRAVAAASIPDSIPIGVPHIVVPGPRTRQ